MGQVAHEWLTLPRQVGAGSGVWLWRGFALAAALYCLRILIAEARRERE